MIEVLYSNPPPLEAAGSAFTREDHRLKELSLVQASHRAPRRSQTHEDYKFPRSSVATIQHIWHNLQLSEQTRVETKSVEVDETPQQPAKETAPRRRPVLGPRRRSYSVTDKEPAPIPSAGVSLLDLPAELHYVIFDFLDPIDSTCLGLTSRHFYTIHRRMRGTVALSVRREGPNELEWAWHLVGTGTRSSHIDDKDKKALSRLRVRGQGYCRKCGVTRCELHKHIQSWMGEGAEYCSIKQKFGSAAPPGAKPYCYMSKPGDSQRCGRHWVRKSKVVLK